MNGDIIVHVGTIKIVVLRMNHCINDLAIYNIMSATGFTHINTPDCV